LIEVTANKAKSAQRRFVRIQPNPAKWLQPCAQQSGDVTPLNYRELFDNAREAAGIHEWPRNGLRHSFASYHLAKFKDAAALALELGHTSAHFGIQPVQRTGQAEAGRALLEGRTCFHGHEGRRFSDRIRQDW
jgi:integrase